MEHALSSRLPAEVPRRGTKAGAKRGTKKVWTVRTTASPITLYRDGRITLKELFRVYAGASADEMPRNLPRWVRQGIEKLRSNGTGQPIGMAESQDEQSKEAAMPHAPDKNRDRNDAQTGQTPEATEPLGPYDLRDELLGLMSHSKRETPYCDRPRTPRSGMSPMDVAERMDGIFEDT